VAPPDLPGEEVRRERYRWLTAAILAYAIGTGLFTAGSVLFFVRSVGLSPIEVGLGLSVAQVTGLTASVPAGAAADRFGPRGVYRVVVLVQAVAAVLFLLVRSFPIFLVVAALSAAGQKSVWAVGNALVAYLGGEQRVALRARVRSVNNLGLALGSLAGGVAIAFDTRWSYSILLLTVAAALGLAALLAGRLPPTPPRPAPPTAARWPVLRDLPYAAVAALDGVLSLQYFVLTVGLPMWVALRTSAPRWIVAGLLALNTLLVVVGQAWASRGVVSVPSAARHLRWAGAVFLAGFALFATSGRVPAPAAVALLVAGVAIHTLGEMWHAAGTFELSFGLAAAHAQGQYQAVFGLGIGAAESLAPVIVTTTVVALGAPGWLLLGAVLVLAGAAMTPASRWAGGRGEG
jgi:MFS family permease